MVPTPTPRPAPLTVAVVVNWRGSEMTARCVAALLASRPRPPLVLVVDNGSGDDSATRIRAQCPDAVLIESQHNLGYGGGNNRGIREAFARGATRVLLVNNDVEVDRDCVARLEEALDRGAPDVGAAGPLVLLPGPERRVWAAGGILSHRENVTRLRGHGAPEAGRFEREEDVDYLPGCILLLRRETLEEVGLFDESFFCYMEDVEFGRRLAEAGWRNRFVPQAVATHDASASTGGGYTPARKYMNAVNSVHFLRRHGGPRAWAGFVLFDVLCLPLAIVAATLRGRPRAGFAKARGLLDGLLGRAVTPERVARYIERHP